MISVIIPTYNNSKLLKQAILSITTVDFSVENFEILIIDNGSVDNTKSVTFDLTSQFPSLNIKYIYEPIPGLLSGRHRGAEIAKGEILVFIDDDIEVTKDWLNAIEDSFKNPDIYIVGGRSLPKFEIEPPYWIETLWDRNSERHVCGYYSLIDLGNEIKEINPNYVFGLNFAIRKKSLYNLGGFHPDCIRKDLQRFQGDGETGLTMKMKQKGFTALYNPKALVYHFIGKERLTVEYLEKRMFYQGVCNSFSRIRRKNSLNQKNHIFFILIKFVSRKINFKKIVILFINQYKIKNIQFSSSENKEIKRIIKRMKISYKKGFNFHQTEVKKDPVLLKWVLKNDYFDYKLPINDG